MPTDSEAKAHPSAQAGPQTKQASPDSNLAQQDASLQSALPKAPSSANQQSGLSHVLPKVHAQRHSIAESELAKLPLSATAGSPSAASDVSSEEYFDYLDMLCANSMDQTTRDTSSVSHSPQTYTTQPPPTSGVQSADAYVSDWDMLQHIAPSLHGETVVNDDEFSQFLLSIEWAECSYKPFAAAMQHPYARQLQRQQQ